MTEITIEVGSDVEFEPIEWQAFTWLNAAGVANDTLSFKAVGDIQFPEPARARIRMREPGISTQAEFSIRSILKEPGYETNQYEVTCSVVTNPVAALNGMKRELGNQLAALIEPDLVVGQPLDGEPYRVPVRAARQAARLLGSHGGTRLSQVLFDYLISQISTSQLNWLQFKEILDKVGLSVFYLSLIHI